MGTRHPEVQKIPQAPSTSYLTGQAVRELGTKAQTCTRRHGQTRSADIRLDEEEKVRGGAPFELTELQVIFRTPVFAQGARPKAVKAKRLSGYHCSRCLQARVLTSLRASESSDVAHEELIGTHCLYIVRDVKAGRRRKDQTIGTCNPLHRQLVGVGLPGLRGRTSEGTRGRGLDVSQGGSGDHGRKLRLEMVRPVRGSHGVTDRAKVFHSFRHNFTDALRLAAVSEDIAARSSVTLKAAYTGDTAPRNGRTLSTSGLLKRLLGVTYAGLDLSHVTSHRATQGHQGSTRASTGHPRPPNAEGSRRSGER